LLWEGIEASGDFRILGVKMSSGSGLSVEEKGREGKESELIVKRLEQ
jgi:hypothetical protein